MRRATILNSASLFFVLRFTTYAVSLSSQKQDGPDDVPILVRLGRGDVQTKTCKLLCEIVGELILDPRLDAAAALLHLFVTESHIISRYGTYAQFPTGLYRHSQRWNVHGYVVAAEELLSMPDAELDAGYSLGLKREALRKGTFAIALGHLLSEPVQADIDYICDGAGSSMDVERKHNHDKRSEKVKVMGVARASRNSIMQRYRSRRTQTVRKDMKIKARAKASIHMNARALAVQRMPHLCKRLRGKLHWEKVVATDDMRKTICQGDSTALAKCVADNKDDLEAEAASVRARARQEHGRPQTGSAPSRHTYHICFVSRARVQGRSVCARDIANVRIMRVMYCMLPRVRARLSKDRRLPTIASGSLGWPSMKTSSGTCCGRQQPAGTRSAIACALNAAPRVSPERDREGLREQVWCQKLFQCKHGWFALHHEASGAKVFMFSCALNGQCAVASLTFLGNRRCSLHMGEPFKDVLKPLPVVADKLAAADGDHVDVPRLTLRVERIDRNRCVFFVILDFDGATSAASWRPTRATRATTMTKRLCLFQGLMWTTSCQILSQPLSAMSKKQSFHMMRSTRTIPTTRRQVTSPSCEQLQVSTRCGRTFTFICMITPVSPTRR